MKFIQWLTVFLSHGTIAVSQKTKNEIAGLPFAQKKIRVIYNGVDDILFKSKEVAQEEIRGITGLPPFKKDHLCIGTIAELHKNKGLPYAINAFHELARDYSSLYLFIIGEGEERENLEQMIEQKELSERVFLLGHLDEAYSLLKCFDIFLLPSLKEGFPYTILEAGKAGVPVIATNVGGIPEVIQHNDTGLLVGSKNKKEIARALKTLLDDPIRRKSCAINLRRKIDEDFSCDTMLTRTLESYS